MWKLFYRDLGILRTVPKSLLGGKMIILASNNNGKVKEIKELLENEDIKTLEEMNINIDVEEDGNTFEENALKKAR